MFALLAFTFILLFSPVLTVQAYHEKFLPRGDTKEIQELIFTELRAQRGLKWALVPEDLSFGKFVLLPQKDYLLKIYTFELSYPARSILYQTFLEYNIRYFLADKTLEYLDYQRDLEKFQNFYQTAKKILGPYFQKTIAKAGLEEEKEGIRSEKELLSGDDLERFLAERLVARISAQRYATSTYGSGSVSSGRWGKLWQQARYESARKKAEVRETTYEVEENVPGFFRKLLSWIFGLIEWFGRNKEVLLILYGFILLIVFLFSAAKK